MFASCALCFESVLEAGFDQRLTRCSMRDRARHTFGGLPEATRKWMIVPIQFPSICFPRVCLHWFLLVIPGILSFSCRSDTNSWHQKYALTIPTSARTLIDYCSNTR
eukprot:2673336-Amphidinium_carterae.1